MPREVKKVGFEIFGTMKTNKTKRQYEHGELQANQPVI